LGAAYRQEAPAGQTGNVTLRVNDRQDIRDASGVVSVDQTNTSRRVIDISNEWPSYSPEGQQRLTKHEWGHVLGMPDVDPDACAGVNTIMRRNGPGAALGNLQLTNGYNCALFGAGNCTPEQLLKQPPDPTNCDAARALVINPSPTPTPTPAPTATPKETCPRPTSCKAPYRWIQCECMPSPILIDVSGDGLALSSGDDGVNFDLDVDGVAERRAWTVAGSDDAWLALDRDDDGSIDDGTELFGDRAPQPVPPEGVAKKGFLALAEFDHTENGGNGDGRIDVADSVFASLRLWRDANHNGLSEQGELHTLPSLGVARLDLDYKTSKRTDEYGNAFRYRAKVRDVRGAQLGRWAWDVFLVAGQ
jgi:hypothetical protein